MALEIDWCSLPPTISLANWPVAKFCDSCSDVWRQAIFCIRDSRKPRAAGLMTIPLAAIVKILKEYMNISLGN